MINPFCFNPALVQRLYSGPLSDYVDAFAQRLHDQGYAMATPVYAMRLLADLGSWLQQHRLLAADLNAQRVDDFLHVRYQSYRPTRSDRAILNKLLEQLQTAGVIATPRKPVSHRPHQAIEEEFERYLCDQRCLAGASIKSYLSTIRRFVDHYAHRQPRSLEQLRAQDVIDFMLQQTQAYTPGHAQQVATALRSFLRYLFQRAIIGVDLAQCVPVTARRQLTELPRFMHAAQVEQLLQSIDQSTVQGRRDYAILLLLARLGLRAGEVATLTLEDIDWPGGALTVQGKRGQRERLPLPWDVGEALVNYLRNGRPHCSTRQLFICLRAPQRGFAHGGAVGTIVRRSLARAGLEPACKGAHLLRHSLATRLLHNGASLTEIGELLRHHALDTTQIYAKVDQRALRALALPWPGARP